MKQIILCILLSTGLFVSSFGNATVLHYRSDPADPATPGTIPFYADVETLLTLEGMNNPAFETEASSFFVGGTGTVELTFTFLRDTGTFNGIFGFYDMADLSAFTLGSADWIDAAVASSTVVFNDNTDAIGSQNSFNIDAGSEIGFMLWTNGFNSLTLFSFEEANPDGSDAGSEGDDMILSFTGDCASTSCKPTPAGRSCARGPSRRCRTSSSGVNSHSRVRFRMSIRGTRWHAGRRSGRF